MTTHSSDQSPPEGPVRLLVGRYLLGDRLGRGGMGIVWRAHDQLLDREVAVKELNVSGLPAEELDTLHSRMKQEARAAARIGHPNVITIHDVVEQDGRPWIVMELIDGRSLAEIITGEGTLLPRDAARVGAQVLGALGQGHRLGVLHRDVKPANVLIDRRGRVVLTDFGIALLEGGSGLTRTGQIVGSPDYLAPERVAGHRPGPESDLWSLGATLYAAVEGQSPFLRSSTIGTLQAVITDPLPEPRHAGPLFPVLEALLRKDPAERATGEQALRMLEEVAQGHTPPTATAVPPPPAYGPGAGGDRSTYPTQSTPPTPLLPPPLPGYPLPQAPGQAPGQTPAPAYGPAYSPAYGYPTPPTPSWAGPPPGGPYGPSGPGGRDPHRRRTWLLVCGVALAAALIGGGLTLAATRGGTHHAAASAPPSPGPSVTTTAPVQPSLSASASPSSSPSPPPTTAAPTPAKPAPGPGTTVNAYYAAINAHDYRTAWNLGGKNLGGSYSSFANGFSTTSNDTITIDSESGDTANVHLHAVHTDGSTADYAGYYTVQNGEITQGSLQQTS
jgi:serine/threonine protein kinase